MSHDLRRDLTDLPRALRETLAKGRPEFETIVRETRWGDGPIYMTGSGSAFNAVLAGAYAFQLLAGWPVVAHPAPFFEACTVPLLRPRSIVVLVSSVKDDETLANIARAAKSRGSVVLTMTSKPDDLPSQRADGVLLLRPGEEAETGFKSSILQRAALSYLAFLAADVLKRHEQKLGELAGEFESLPGRIEWVSSQLRDAARSLGAELRNRHSSALVGGGAYYPASLEGAYWLRKIAHLAAEGVEVCEFQTGMAGRTQRDLYAVFVSGSRCRMRKHVHQAAKAWVTSGAGLLAITDANDQELTSRARLAVLLPVSSDITGSILAAVLLGWVAISKRNEPEQPKSKGRDNEPKV